MSQSLGPVIVLAVLIWDLASIMLVKATTSANKTQTRAATNKTVQRHCLAVSWLVQWQCEQCILDCPYGNVSDYVFVRRHQDIVSHE
jgi:hypothetical protein